MQTEQTVQIETPFGTTVDAASAFDDRDVQGGGCVECGSYDAGLPVCDACDSAFWAPVQRDNDRLATCEQGR